MARLIEDELLMQRIITDIPEMDVELRKKVFDVIDEMPIVCEWIPVSERVPENDDFVLCYSTVCGHMVGWHFGGVWMDNKYNVLDVTHWMPLPRKYEKEVEE